MVVAQFPDTSNGARMKRKGIAAGIGIGSHRRRDKKTAPARCGFFMGREEQAEKSRQRRTGRGGHPYGKRALENENRHSNSVNNIKRIAGGF